FHELARAALAGRPNVTLLRADILRNKNELNRNVMAALEGLWRESGRRRLKLVANLPYAVATTVLGNFLLSGLPWERLEVTVQWETGEGVSARPGTKDYGALAVLVQSLADVEVVRRLAPSVFWPRPQVASAIVGIRPDPAKRAHVGDAVRFRNF